MTSVAEEAGQAGLTGQERIDTIPHLYEISVPPHKVAPKLGNVFSGAS